MTTDNRLGIGGNSPPSEIELLNENLSQRNEKALARANALLAAADRVPDKVEDQETSDKITDLENLISSCWAIVEGGRVKEKAPFMVLERAVDDFFRIPLNSLLAAKRSIKAKQTAFLVEAEAKEKKRRDALAAVEAEKAKALTAQAATLEAAGKTIQATETLKAAVMADEDAVFFTETAKETGAAVAHSRGEATGAKSSLKYTPTGEIENFDELDVAALKPYLTAADCQKALNKYVKIYGLTKPLKGAKIWNKPDSVTR